MLSTTVHASIRVSWGPEWEGFPEEVPEAGAEVGERLTSLPRICQPRPHLLPHQAACLLGTVTPGAWVCVWPVVSGPFYPENPHVPGLNVQTDSEEETGSQVFASYTEQTLRSL